MKPISIGRCQAWDYEYEAIRCAIQASFDRLGGVAAFVKPGEKVLLKVNLVMKKTPEAAATSHPVFVQALADILIAGAAVVIIADSPGGPFNEMRLRSIYSACGMKAAAEKSGALLNFDIGACEVSNPQGLLLRRLTNIDILRKVDKVINVSKLKTHGMMKMTGAVKNMFGTVPGTMKAEYHLNRPEPEQFADALIDICLCANPILSFIDGIVAMEGDGPTSGTPRRVGVLLASEDPFGMDLVAASIIHVEALSIPTVKQSIKRGLCPSDYRELSLVGDVSVGKTVGNLTVEQSDPVAAYRVYDFKAPMVQLVNPLSGGKFPKFVKRFTDRYAQAYPVFLHERCIGCGDCVRNCPPAAISMENPSKPGVDLNKCIRCFCCQELCPQKAVLIKRPWLFRVITKL